MASKALLPEQDALLCELADAYDELGDRPQVRVGPQGRSGSRVWMWGDTHRELPGKRKPEDLGELRANGDLRQVKKDKTGTYYALTPGGLTRRAKIARTSATKPPAPRIRNSGPPPVLTTAPSRLELLRKLADDARTALDAVLAVSSVVDTFAGLPVVSPHPWSWASVAPEQQPLIGTARKALGLWLEGGRGAIQASAPERLVDFIDEEDTLMRVIDRSSRADGPTAPDIAGTQRATNDALERQLDIIQNLPSANERPTTLLVPDTNALIFDPAIEKWSVGSGLVVITVLPQVIAELDGKKMDASIGEKAKSLIRRFKEFDRRGDTLVGVPIVGKTVFREIALESPFKGAPSWLDRRNADDRILMGALDLSQQELASRVVLVTRDRNLQNKARRLGLAYVDADEL